MRKQIGGVVLSSALSLQDLDPLGVVLKEHRTLICFMIDDNISWDGERMEP